MVKPNKTNIIASLYQAFDHETVTVGASVVQLTQATFLDDDGDPAKRAIITVEDAQIRYRYDGLNPTASAGHLLNPMDVLILLGTTNIQNFRAIRKGSVDGILRITYER